MITPGYTALLQLPGACRGEKNTLLTLASKAFIKNTWGHQVRHKGTQLLPLAHFATITGFCRIYFKDLQSTAADNVGLIQIPYQTCSGTW